MPKYKLIIEYDGAPYFGWQKQPDRPSIQGELQAAILKFSGQEVDVVGAGRTDTGVHAIAQAAHIELDKEFEPFRVMQGINFYLFNPNGNEPTDDGLPANRIAITHVERVGDEFSARFSATKRHYLYRIVNRRSRVALEAGRVWHVVEPLDVAAMQEAAKFLIGHNDFTSFRDTACQAKSPIKTLEQLDIKQYGNEVRVFSSARSFLHHQVRIMVGTLAQVGRGKWSPQDVKDALDAKERSASGPTAPPDGLYLVKVDY